VYQTYALRVKHKRNYQKVALQVLGHPGEHHGGAREQASTLDELPELQSMSIIFAIEDASASAY
jgi:hypothetical protein